MNRCIDPHELGRLEQRFAETLSVVPILKAAAHLGPLTSWWLDPDALSRLILIDPEYAAGAHLPLPDMQVGSCRILAVRERLPPEPRLLAKCLVFPLQWSFGTSHSQGLPRPLVCLAERVRDELEITTPWGLQPAFPLRDINLSQWTDFKPDSGWASLAASLILASQGIRPRPEVWASAAYQRGECIVRVAGIEEKIAAARRFGAQHVFLPIENRPDAAGWTTRTTGMLALHYLPFGASRPRDCLRPYLDLLGQPPTADDSFETRSNFYVLLSNPAQARQYYLDVILDEAVTRLTPEFERQANGRYDTLITVVSHSDELARLAARIVGPSKCLLLHDVGRDQSAGEIRRDLAHHGIDARIAAFNDEPIQSLRIQFERAILENAPGDRVVVDLTPGKKKMSVALAEIALSRGFDCLYVDHREQYAGRARPDSLTVELRRCHN